MEQTGFKLNRQALFGMMVLAAAGAMPAYAATINVTANAADVIANDGVCSLREAVIAANTNVASGVLAGECAAGESAVTDVINVPAGTYTLSLEGADEVESPVTPLLLINTPDPTIGDLDITESVNITGAGSASTTIQWDTVGERDRIFHVFVSTVDAVAVNVAISGVKLTQGFTAQEDLGPGPTSAFGQLPTNYYLRRGGGALAVGPASAVVLVDPNVTGADSATDHGGSQRPDTPDEGGATFTLALNDVIVDSNHADGDGGGIYNSAPMTATNIVVSNNDNITNGGGIYNEGLTTISNSTISGNTAEGGGGLFVTGAEPITIRGSTFNANRAVGGGAISGRSGVAINMVNSTLSGNLAEDVGAGFYHNGPASLNFVTIANNITGGDSPTAGAGVNTFPSGSVNVTLKNVLLVGNMKAWEFATYPNPANDPTLLPANCGSTSGAMSITSAGNNLSSDASCTTLIQGTDKNSIDPKISALADNGGPTWTHALATDSPALSAGASDASVTVDQRDQPRESPPDIGAFELDNIAEGGGGGGGGCALGGDGRLDPTLPAMLAAALAFFGWRRRPAK